MIQNKLVVAIKMKQSGAKTKHDCAFSAALLWARSGEWGPVGRGKCSVPSRFLHSGAQGEGEGEAAVKRPSRGGNLPIPRLGRYGFIFNAC